MLSAEAIVNDFKFQTEFAHSIRRGKSIDTGYILGQYTFLDRYTPFAMWQTWNPGNWNPLTGSDENSSNKQDFVSVGMSYHIVPWITQLKFQFDHVDNINNNVKDYDRWFVGISTLF